MNKKISLGICLSLMIIASAVTFILTSNFTLRTINDKVTNINEREEIYKKISDIDSKVQEYFYGSVDPEKIVDAVAQGYMTLLKDPYASYNTVEENDKRELESDGKMIGVGITCIPAPDQSGYIYIDSVKKGSPAQKAEMTTGSLIVEVDGESVLSLGYSEAVKKISGIVGTNVTVTVRENGIDRDIVLVREELEIISVNFKMVEEIAYIQITEFNNATTDQFLNALILADEADAKGIIFDVRNNLGGTLSSTLDILDRLLPEGVIAISKDKNGKETVLGTSDKEDLDIPMTVLVNQRTASAAELFSAALRDYEKAELVGMNTFGKGIMQKTYPLSDGSSVTFTIASYQTIKTSNIDGNGLKPDYEVPIDTDYLVDFEEVSAQNDVQFSKAIEVLKVKIK